MFRRLAGFVWILLLLTACGPSPESAATMSAPAPTATLHPTPAPPTPTAVPFNLTVSVTDQTGAPISWARISTAGAEAMLGVDDQGRVSFTNLPEAAVSVSAEAQGYLPAKTTQTLVLGDNELTLSLERDPFGLLPPEACAPGEELLYIEDFQDGAVTEWGTYPPGSQVSIVQDPDEAANRVLELNFGEGDGEYQVRAIPLQDSVVSRFVFKPGDHSRFTTGWGTGENDYFVQLSADQFDLMAVKDGQVVPGLARGRPRMEKGVWHMLELATVGDYVEVWGDGEQEFTYQGPPPAEGDILKFGAAYLPPESVVLIDNVAICKTSGPFTSRYSSP
jgi:hypothetical protein